MLREIFTDFDHEIAPVSARRMEFHGNSNWKATHIVADLALESDQFLISPPKSEANFLRNCYPHGSRAYVGPRVPPNEAHLKRNSMTDHEQKSPDGLDSGGPPRNESHQHKGTT